MQKNIITHTRAPFAAQRVKRGLSFKVLNALPNNYAFKFAHLTHYLPEFHIAAIDAAMIYTNDAYGVKIAESNFLHHSAYYVYTIENKPLFRCSLDHSDQNNFVISELMKRGQNIIKARAAAKCHLVDMSESDEMAHILNTANLLADVNRYFNF